MNPGCENIQALLSDYAEGELTDADGRTVEEHLKSCRACAGELTLMRALVSGLHRIPEETAPPAILAALSRRLPSRTAPSRSLWPSWLGGWRLAASSAAAAVVVMALLHPGVRGPRTSSSVQFAANLTLVNPVAGVTVDGKPVSGASAAVAEGARVETPGTSGGPVAATLAYADGSTAELSGGTRLTAGADELRLDTGSIEMAVEKQKLHFRVRTPDALVTVWGTRYRVTHRSVTSVDVHEGKVQVEALRSPGHGVMLTAGQRAEVDGAQVNVPKPASSPEPARPEDTRLPLGDDR
ncbi:MAG: FecR domain-containing protein [Candidatus Wallbacteria bacterium]|nr:FecR domain-containing protein [Candidatus Wallbacteria bacterium]